MPTRRFLAALTAAALVACTAAGEAGTDPDVEAPADETVVVPAVPADSIPVALATATLATCTPAPLDSASKVIGRNGGQIRLGRNQLQIGRDALSEDVRITLVTGGDSLAAVRIEPAGVTFAAAGRVKLKLDYSHCAGARASGNSKRVVRLDDADAIVAAPESADDGATQGTEGTIPLFGRYGIAY